MILDLWSRSIKTALIITSYNWTKALELVLESIARQTILPNHILIADDGSSFETRVLIHNWTQQWPWLTHVWQPDASFRAARVRNLAVLKTNADHIIFTDGDCLLPPNFIEKHRYFIRSNTLIAGGRYLADREATNLLLSGDLAINSNLFSGLKFKSLPLGSLRDLRPDNWASVRTCNCSMLRSDFHRAGGFDESYVGWGKEDSDFVFRLLNMGLSIRSARLGTCVYHLDHMVNDRSSLTENEAKLDMVLRNTDIVAPRKTSVGSL
jgi:GT2 family glycosyltransferase